MSPRSRRALLMLSAALSAFILVLVGAAASFAWRPTPATRDTAPVARQPVEVRRAPPREREREHDRERRHVERERHHEHDEDDDG